MTSSSSSSLLLGLLFAIGALPIPLFPPLLSCPSSDHCLCQPGPSLICSCSPARPKIRLSNHLFPLRMTQLVIHSCPSIVISTGTFAHKSVLDQIKFLNIGSLHFESGSFRALRRSPRLLLFQNISRIPSLSPLAFAGLGRLQHFWFVNVSIGRVQPRAFAKLWPLDYLYFRHVHIQRVESNGFGQIPRIGHFFLRDRIRLDWISEGAFRGSGVEEMVVENGIVKGHIGAFLGVRAKRVRLLNCQWGGTAKRGNIGMSKGKEETSIGEMLIRNSTLWTMFLLGHLQSLLLVENSSIGRWPANPRMSGGQQIRILNSRIRHWEAPGIGWAETVVKGSRIGAVRRPAHQHRHHHHHPLPPLRLQMTNSRVRLLSSHSFAGLLLASFQLLNSTVARWHGSPLAMIAKGSGDILIGNSLLNISAVLTEGEERSGPFAGLNAHALRLQNSTIESPLGSNPFWQTNVDRLEVRECRFRHSLEEGLFDGLTANAGTNFSQNEWPCGQGHKCGIGQLLLASPPLPHWLFSANRCQPSPSPSPASECLSSSSSVGPLLCRHLGLLQECLCIAPSSPLPAHPLPLRPLPQTRVLLLSDCPDSIVRLHWPTNSSSSSILSHLYAFRVGQLQFGQLPSSLRHLHVRHSAVAVQDSRAFHGANLVEMSILDGRLDGEMPADNFEWSRLGQTRLEGTEVGREWAKALLAEMEEDDGGGDGEVMLRKRCSTSEEAAANCPAERNGGGRRARVGMFTSSPPPPSPSPLLLLLLPLLLIIILL